MKKISFAFLLLVSMFTIFPIITDAESIINNKGVVISEEEYNDFLKVYSDVQIMNMNYEKYEKLKTLDFNDIKSDEKFFKSTYNDSLKLLTEQEISEEEYDNFGNGIMPIMDNKGAYAESTAKKLTLFVIGGSYWNFVVFGAAWKGVPVHRSYDIIGMRAVGLEFRNGSQQGEQTYGYKGEYKEINYAWNGTNIKKFDNGFGISMNIVNDDIDYLTLEVECDVTPTEDHPEIFASYQHALKNLSLKDSQNYTLGGGLGYVFVYPYSITEKYDNMSGVDIRY